MKIPLTPITDWKDGESYVIQYNLGQVWFKQPDTRQEIWQKGVHITKRDEALIAEHCQMLYNSKK